MRTSVPGVYAAGDLIDRPMEMFKARKAGVCAARQIMGETDYEFDYSDFPDFLHTTYEVAWTGLSEAEAREKYDNVMVIQMPPKGVAPEDCGLPPPTGRCSSRSCDRVSTASSSRSSTRTPARSSACTRRVRQQELLPVPRRADQQPGGFTIDQMAEVNELFLNDGFPQLHRLRAGELNPVDL